jgi:hypothetical protein
MGLDESAGTQTKLISVGFFPLEEAVPSLVA